MPRDAGAQICGVVGSAYWRADSFAATRDVPVLAATIEMQLLRMVSCSCGLMDKAPPP